MIFFRQIFIALFVATLAVAVKAGYVQSSWPVSTYGFNSWNGLNAWNGLNSWDGLSSWNNWNDHGTSAYPYGYNKWSSPAWPAASLYNGYNGYNGWYGATGKTVVQANVAKVNSWGLPLTSYGYGYNNYLGAVPAAKYVAANPGSVHVAPLVGHAINQKLIVA
ncbi:conserved hypothetical protein [Culex quinquefasciatus]|uniref:Uncharacterized protein n=1 Tax=Culex quinquefasciatus TaxID=7176 RepID=B0W8Z2_CULQU|nr:conserved hypothetical protein [Culex quinquefasciatus]|eukprot:XP_001845106.1 conserved hypothetical protein [Culex quinquefasciatus]